MTRDELNPEGAMPDDETLAAWLDGALDAEGARRMTELAARHEALARRVERMRHVDDLVRLAVPAEEAVPPALLERLGLAPAGEAKVVSLADARAARAQPAVARRSGGVLLRMAAQLALVAGVGLAVLVLARPAERVQDPAAAYRALGTSPGAAARSANALIRFAPGIAASEADRIARGAGIRLIGEPNAAGAWKAVVEPGRRAASLEALRADTRVMMAEPIDGKTP
ncbi:hypothetical protein [Novosphingobium sp.]|uniref:anti-sigma factor family protein n=1 Tax=Novosphingobium sp. TaxID=1874826 RepID=UPI002615942C|nr:hypothetical protein [Novosphingobium sp.]